jgi:hypothetical protein
VTEPSQEPAAGFEAPEPPPAANEPPAPAVLSRPRGFRLMTVIVVSVLLALLVLGAAGLLLYNRLTTPDRSTPSVVTRQFFQAALVDRQIQRVALFVCKAWPPVNALNQILTLSNGSLQTTWGVTSVTQTSPSNAIVEVRVIFSHSGDGLSQRDVEVWRLSLSKEDGWRVCGLSHS